MPKKTFEKQKSYLKKECGRNIPIFIFYDFWCQNIRLKISVNGKIIVYCLHRKIDMDIKNPQAYLIKRPVRAVIGLVARALFECFKLFLCVKFEVV